MGANKVLDKKRDLFNQKQFYLELYSLTDLSFDLENTQWELYNGKIILKFSN